jgi:glyoxylase-like metal-dependent hydrolase (beta-lactamase superfamily II)
MTVEIKLPDGMHVFERGWLSSNNILFEDGQHSLLVDSGYCTHALQTIGLVETSLGERPLDALVNTHLHSDHCGGNAALQSRYPELETFIPPGRASAVEDWDTVALTYLPTGQLCPRFSFTQILQTGTEMRFGSTVWEVHAAPGHDPHSLLFFQPTEGILISADALWENGFGVVFPELEGAEAFKEVGATLDLIERLAPNIVVPGHGRVFSYSSSHLALARQRLNAFINNPGRHAHHAAKVLLKFKLLELQSSRLDDFVKWALATGYLTDIRKKFFGDIRAGDWITGLCEELVKSGAAMRDGLHICNA